MRRYACLALACIVACKEAPPRPTCPDGVPSFAVSATPAPSSSGPVPSDDDAQLQFVASGKVVHALRKHALRSSLPSETVHVADNYYEGRPKSWRAIPMKALLERGFEGTGLALPEQSFILRCVDGYTVPLDGKRLFENGGYVAFADAEVPSWEPVGPKRDHPGPYFVVWTGKDQQSLESYPRPYQLATIEVASFEATFPHVVPKGVPDGSPETRGLALFKEQCIRCHAVNREGGRVGPELNVPRNVLEYRDEATVRAFIRDPSSFRYSAMPSHPHLTDGDLDGLVAYLKAMGQRKHDPLASKGSVSTSGAPR